MYSVILAMTMSSAPVIPDGIIFHRAGAGCVGTTSARSAGCQGTQAVAAIPVQLVAVQAAGCSGVTAAAGCAGGFAAGDRGLFAGHRARASARHARHESRAASHGVAYALAPAASYAVVSHSVAAPPPVATKPQKAPAIVP